MKKTAILSLSLFFLTIAYTAAVFAQTVKQIQFAKGKSSATVKGNTGSYGAYYAIRAKSGQVLVLDLSPNKQVGIRVETETTDGQVILLRQELGGHYEIPLEESGEYTILVGSTNGKPVPFTLTVKVRKMRDI